MASAKCSDLKDLEKKRDTINLHKGVKEAVKDVKRMQKGTNDTWKVIWKTEDKFVSITKN